MKKIIIKLQLFTYLFVFFLCAGVFAQSVPDAFVVDIEPSSFDVNEAVDMTIKAVDANGETLKTYEWDVFIEIKEIFDSTEYVLPNDGFYSFVAQDQWVKLFSKGLIIKKVGTYTIEVSDLIEPDIKGTITTIIGKKEDKEAKNINIISPVAWSVQNTETIDVLAKSIDLPNSTFQVYMNWIVVAQWVSTENWDISAYASWLKVWENELQIKIVDINSLVIGQSNVVKFTYQSITDNIFNGIDVLPWVNVKQWDKVTFNVQTNDQVTSVELRLSNGSSFPMDRITAGTFTKQVLMENYWDTQVSLSLMVAWNKKVYDNVKTLTVQENIGISNIRFYVDSVDKTKLTVMRTPIGQIAQYKFDYGDSPTNLTFSQTISVNEISIPNLNPDATYYVKISPMDSSSRMIWTPSQVEEIQPWHLWAWDAGPEDTPACIVKWINVYTGRVWSKYYLMRDEVPDVEKYVVYRSDRETNDLSKMQKVGETTLSRFEYPFNNSTYTDQYAFYAVTAVCTWGTSVQIDSVKKVQVWPMDNLILVLVLSGFIYVVFRLYNISTN